MTVQPTASLITIKNYGKLDAKPPNNFWMYPTSVPDALKTRGYYDLLVFLTKENQIKKNAMETETLVEESQTIGVEVMPTPLC